MDALFSCFKEAIGVLRKRKAWLISFGAAILTGVVLGLVLPKPASVRQYYLTYCRAYTDGIFVSSVFRLFFRRLISVVLLLLLIVPLYFTVYYLPAAFLLVSFKGYTFGIVTVILLSSYGIGGFFIFLICAFPTALLTFALLAIACTLGGEICRKRPPACGNGGIFCSFLLLLIGATACALAEILLVTIIFRPVSKIF